MQFQDFDNKKKMIYRLFPYIKEKELVSNLLIDDASIYYITPRVISDKITSIIKYHLKILGINMTDTVITDSTAGVGGNTISFGKNFKIVHSIEIDTQRYEYLNNNISIFKLNNILTYNDDCLNKLSTIDNHDAVFIDPPWESKESGSYKQFLNLRLKIGDTSIENICLNLMNKDKMKKTPSIIVFKLPINYDLYHFYKQLKNKQIYYYNLFKMIILVIVV